MIDFGSVARVTQTHLPSDSPAESPADPDRTDSREIPALFRQGHILAGRYRIEKFLDRGGMGEVYDASDLLLEEHVALKVMREPCTPESPFLSRLRSEVQLARRVTHPNVCRIFDMGLDGETAFLTMELLSGETLAQRIKRDGTLDTEEALPLVEQMSAGLAAVHAAGIIHRDFKCANVFLVPHDGGVRAVITDFGVARVGDAQRRSSNVTSTGVVLGTPAFMAPEQVEGKKPTPLIDVYALGVVMFNMLTGDYPFDGDSVYSVATKRVKEDPASPKQFVPDLDPAWEAVILRCLEREPEARFSSVADVPGALRGDGPELEPEDERPHIDRKWFLGAMAGAAVVATTIGLLVAGGGDDVPVPAPRAQQPAKPSIVIVEKMPAPAAPQPAPAAAAAAVAPAPPPAPEPEPVIEGTPEAPRKKTKAAKAKVTASKPRTPSPSPPVVDDDAPLPVP